MTAIPDRLSWSDLANLRAERPGTPWHVGLLAILDGSPLTDPDGGLRLEPVRSWLERALRRTPRLRQIVGRPDTLLPPSGLRRPVWTDAPRFTVDQHLRVAPVAQPGDPAALLRACAAVLEPPLDRSRPLWDLTLLPGLADGTVGAVFRIHPAIADGVAAVQLFDALLTDEADPAGRAAVQEEPAAQVRTAQVRAAQVRAAQVRAAQAAAAGGGGGTSLLARARALGWQLASATRPAPRSSLNRPVGPTRRLAVLEVARQPLRQVAHKHGGTVNDAVLTAVAAALRQVLVARAEASEIPLRASVPVSLRTSGDPQWGNRVGVLAIPLPLDEPDPIRALVRVAAATREAKVRARQAGPLTAILSTAAVRVAPLLLRHQRLVNLFVTNVPGPIAPLHLAGTRVREAYPAAGLAGNVTLSVAVLSYGDRLGLGMVADAATWPDLAIFADGLRDAFDALGGTGRGPTGAVP